MYKSIIRPLFFSFDPEKIHEASFSLMRFAHKAGLLRLVGAKDAGEFPRLKQNLFGIDFPNPVGLAAGFDKNAQLFTELSSLGFGFIEIGTVTPKPQEGNPKKRLFRLKEDEGIINRMGFNNEGVAAAVERLKKNPKVGEKGHVIIGGNIGKNKTTPNEEAVKDYLICFHALFEYVDYFVVNVSSPNTPDLRALQEKEPLTSLLKALQDENAKKQSKKPILLKIAPDLNNDQLLDIIEIVEKSKIDGVIATNTTLSRDGLSSKNKTESGGLSGRPLTERATEVIRFLSEKSNKAFPIIGVGGIHSPEDAIEKIKAGASLIQLYTGFIYEGPQLIEKINKALIETHL